MRRCRLLPGDWVALALIGEALLIDVVLVRGRHDPISTCVRRSLIAKAVVIGLGLHLCCTIPNDPLTRTADWLSERWAVA